ncbi:MAG: hypothetical protein Q9220_005748 [cf. Caloplaca sp. 1 TL-2023]
MPKSQFDIAWRDQNTVASKAVQRRVKAREAQRNENTGEELIRIRPDEVPRVLPQDLENYAVTFFFNSYILAGTGSATQRGFLGCLYPIWMQAGATSPLRPAVSAVASALLEAWSQSNPNSSQSLARSHYGKGIEALRRHLQNKGHIDDDILMTNLMLDMYNGTISFCGAMPQACPHMAGTMALIEHRRKLPVNSEISRRVLLGTRSMVLGNALRSREPVPEHLLKWTTDGENVPQTSINELEEIDLEVAILQASTQTVHAMDDVSASAILVKANELDARLVAWSTTIPHNWIPECIWETDSIPQSIRDAGLYQAHCTIHESVFIANILNGHCCSRIKVQLINLAYLQQIDDESSGMARLNACNIVQDMADTICASIPYFLGDRVRVLRFDDRTPKYPRIESEATPKEHYDTAAAYAGIFLTQKISQLLPPGLPLRPGQREWILGQMQRIKKIYLAEPHKAT